MRGGRPIPLRARQPSRGFGPASLGFFDDSDLGTTSNIGYAGFSTGADFDFWHVRRDFYGAGWFHANAGNGLVQPSASGPAVAEPGSLVLLGSGLTGLMRLHRGRRS